MGVCARSQNPRNSRRRRAQLSMVGGCVLAAMLTLSACGSNDDAQTPSTSVIAGVSPTAQAPAASSESAPHTTSEDPSTSVETPQPSTPQAEPTLMVTTDVPVVASREGKFWGGDDYDPATAARLPHERLEIGQDVDILGTVVEVCSTGDAYGIHYVGASPEFGCDSAVAVSEAALKDEDPAANVHFDKIKPVRAADTMFNCSEQGNIVLTCVDDRGNSVLMW